MIKNDILPCPFCGNEKDFKIVPEYAEDDPTWIVTYHVYCKWCHARGRNCYPIGWCESEQAAIEAWNDRTIDEKDIISKIETDTEYDMNIGYVQYLNYRNGQKQGLIKTHKITLKDPIVIKAYKKIKAAAEKYAETRNPDDLIYFVRTENSITSPVIDLQWNDLLDLKDGINYQIARTQLYMDIGLQKHEPGCKCVNCEGIEVILQDEPKPYTERVYEWLRGNDRGISSETIFEVMDGYKFPISSSPVQHSPPRDPDDFGRCYRLLSIFPEWVPRLKEVSDRYPFWKPIIEHWDELTNLYVKECTTGKTGNHPALYYRLQELNKEWRY